MTRHILLYLFATLFLLAGCPSDDDDAADDDDDATDDDDSGDDDDDANPDDISTSCDDAPAMPMNGEWTESELEDPDDEDFFTITVDEDAFLNIWTGFYDEGTDGQLDPVVTLYTADGATLLATADDQIPRANTDSELRYRAVAGTYCVKIEGWEHWSGSASSQETTDWTYALNALEMDPDIPDLWYEGVLNPDTEPNDGVAEAQQGTLYEGSSGVYGTIYGLLDSADDVDVYAFTTSDSGAHISVDFYRPTGPGSSGSEGHGTTLELGTIDISNPAGAVIGSVDGTLGIHAISMPFQGEQQILLWVRAPEGWTSGANDFYVIDLYNAFQSNPLEDEQADSSNDSIGSAESTSFSDGSAYLAGYLDPAGDIDFWEFSSDADQVFAIACGARRNGSGLDGAVFSVQSSDGTPLQTEVETAEADVLWSDSTYVEASMDALQITEAGDYYLRIVASGQLPGVSDTSYMCGIHNSTP